MTLERILVGIDLSKQSLRALDVACELARYRSAELLLARVCDLPRLRSWLDVAAGRVDDDLDTLERERMDEEARHIEGLRKRVAADGFEVRTVLRAGTPDRELIGLADEERVSLLMLGDLGRTADEGGELGGVAARVARGARQPVWIARRGARARSGVRRILVATDFSGNSATLIAAAKAVAAPDALIDLLFCWTLPVDTYSRAMVHRSPEELQRGVRAQVEEQAQQRGEALVEAHEDEQRELTFVMREARARSGVLAQLEEVTYDLVVVGSHGRSGFRRLALGSTADAIARRAPISVLVVPVGRRGR